MSDEVLYERARTLLDEDRFEEAIGQYQRLLEHWQSLPQPHPKLARLYSDLGFALDALNRPEEALGAFEESLRLDQELVPAIHNKGRILRILGRVDESIAVLERLLRHRPDLPQSWHSLACAYETRGDLSTAAAAFARSLDLQENSNARRSFNAILDRICASEKWSQMEAIISDAPESREALQAVARAFAEAALEAYESGDYEESQRFADICVDSFRRFLDRTPGRADSWMEFGEFLTGLSRHADAVGAFECALAIDGSSENAWAHFAKALEAQGLAGAAASARARTLAIDWDMTQPRIKHKWVNREPVEQDDESVDRAWKLLQSQRYREAEAVFQEALAVNPDRLWAGAGLGLALISLDRERDAVPVLERVLQLEPRFVLASQKLGDLAIRSGDVRRGVTLLGQTLKNFADSSNEWGCSTTQPLAAIQALQALAERDERIPDMLAVAARDPTWVVRAAAVEALVRCAGSGPPTPVVEALADPALPVRDAVLTGISRFKPAWMADLVKAAARNENWQVRKRALALMRQLELRACAGPEAFRARSDEHHEVKVIACQILESVAGRRSLGALIALLADKNDRVRHQAARCLGGRNEDRARLALVEALTDWWIAGEAADALQKLGWQPSTPREQTHRRVARRHGDDLRKNWDSTQETLLSDIRFGTWRLARLELRNILGLGIGDPPFVRRHTIENALYAFIGLGRTEIIPMLVDMLDRTEDKVTAEAYLNCGHSDLANAATRWAEKRGYHITHRFGAHPVSWGRF